MDLMIVFLGVLLVIAAGIIIGQSMTVSNLKATNKHLNRRLSDLQDDYYAVTVTNANASNVILPDDKALEGLKIAVRAGVMTENEARELAQKLELGPYETPTLIPGDDICPECGEAFDVQDDYVCADCREQLNDT